MLTKDTSTLRQKIEVIESCIRTIKPIQALDYEHSEAYSALSNALIAILQYPSFSEIKKYPLGRSLADNKAIAIEKNLCICLSGNAPWGTLEIIEIQLHQALNSLQSQIED